MRQLQVLETARIKEIDPGPGVAEITESPGNSGVISYPTRMVRRRGVYPGRTRKDAQMAQAATAQRTAERAARDRLAGPLISAVGELGVAVAQRETAAAGVSEAEERAREHVRRVQAEAQEMVAAERAQVAAAD